MISQIDLEKLLSKNFDELTKDEVAKIINGLKDTLFNLQIRNPYGEEFKQKVYVTYQKFGYYYKYYEDAFIKELLINLF